MKTRGLFETKNKLSEFCQRVSVTGEPLTITRHGKPFVRIVPIEEGDDPVSVWDTVRESEAVYGPLDAEIDLPTRDPDANRPCPLDGEA